MKFQLDLDFVNELTRQHHKDMSGFGFKCPKCQNTIQNTSIADAIDQKRCASCKHVWSVADEIDWNSLLVGLYKIAYMDAVNNYAIWKDGKQHIGCMGQTSVEILVKLDNHSIPLRY